MCAMWRASAPLKDALRRGCGWDELSTLLVDLFLESGGPFGRSLRRGMSAKGRVEAPGISVQQIFPVPLLSLRLPPLEGVAENERDDVSAL